MFYDNKLQPIQEYDRIIWRNEVFDTEAKLSQLVYFFKDRFPKEKKIGIIHHVSLIFDSFETINNSDLDVVIVNFSDHPLTTNLLHMFTKPVIALNFDFNTEQYHPWHLLWSHWLSKNDGPVDFESTRSKQISFMYVKTRITRVFNVIELSNRPYFDKIYTTWIDKFTSPTQLVNEDGLSANDIDQHWDKYLEIEKTIPDVKTGTEFNSCQMLGAGYTDTYLNIVLEARIADFGFLTEKIFKPVRAGQLFLAQASPGTIRYLRSIGFDTFDDYIDHDRYDNIKDWKLRTKSMHSVLDDIAPRLEEIFLKTTERRKRNSEWLKNDALVNFVLSQ